MDDIHQRIGRIYSAIEVAQESDPQKLRGKFVQTEKFFGMFHDFRGGLSDEELSNQAYSVIHNIANLKDNLKRWASKNGQSKDRVDQVIANCFELQVMIDLSNYDKHGPPRKGESRSGRCPRLVSINRVMQLQTQPKAGSVIAMTIGADGLPKFMGDGIAKAVVTGDVVDDSNAIIGELHEMTLKAVTALESLLVDFALLSAKNSP